MSSRPTPPTVTEQGFGEFKERRSAWKRWEMNPIAPDMLVDDRRAKPVIQSPLASLASIALIDQAAVEKKHLDAKATGHQEGYQEGFLQGQSEGYAAGMANARERAAAQLRSMTLEWTNALKQADAQLAEDLLALSLDLARQVLGQALKLEPQAMLTVVHELLRSEPALVGSPQLFLHPDDAALVKEYLNEDLQDAGWRIRLDPELTRGGCRVMANSGERDATLETRWERVAAALNRNASATVIPDHD